MRILIIEDDDRIAKPLAEDLKHQHHVVEIARDGMEGWQYAQADNYDLILRFGRSECQRYLCLKSIE